MRHDALQGALPLLVLKILARRGPLHGYGIAVQIESMSNDVLRVEEGSLYPALHRMELDGWIYAEWGVSDNNRRAKFYKLTAKGRKALEKEADHWRELAAAIARVMEAV